MNLIWQVSIDSWRRLTKRGQTILVVYSFCLIATSSLDFFSLMIVSKISNQAVADLSTIQSKTNIGLILLCVILFIVRSLIAAGITWVGTSAFARQEVLIGEKNLQDYLKMNWATRSTEKLSDIFAFVDRGPHAMTQQLLFSVATLIAEIFSTLIIVLVLFVFDPITATVSLIFFVGVAYIQHVLISQKSSNTGAEMAQFQNSTYDLLSDVFRLDKVLSVMPSRSLESTISYHRSKLAHARARSLFFESLPRYLMELVLILGAIVIGIAAYFFKGNSGVIPALSLFGLAGFRLLPGVNRIQGIILGLLGREPLARLGLRKIDERKSALKTIIESHPESSVVMRLRDICYSYPNSSKMVLQNVNLEFKMGLQYAIVGPSGSGKSTLLDICMGLLTPTLGRVELRSDFGQSIGYVPQDNYYLPNSMYSNVALEWDENEVEKDNADQALRESGLSSILSTSILESPNYLILSGGQNQRVGIARALYRNPDVIFLDEPTSALDAESENEVVGLIDELRGKKTVFIVAHRLTTVKNADLVVFLDEGRVLGVGTFSSLKISLPLFARYVELSLI